MNHVAAFILAQRKPLAAKLLRDVAVSAALPLLFPRGNRPLRRTSVTPAKKIERSSTSTAALARCSPAGVAEQAAQTDARTSCQKNRCFCGVAIVIFPPELATDEVRTRREPKICGKRQFGGAARVISPAEVTTYKEKIRTTADKLGRAPRLQHGLR